MIDDPGHLLSVLIEKRRFWDHDAPRGLLQRASCDVGAEPEIRRRVIEGNLHTLAVGQGVNARSDFPYSPANANRRLDQQPHLERTAFLQTDSGVVGYVDDSLSHPAGRP